MSRAAVKSELARQAYGHHRYGGLVFVCSIHTYTHNTYALHTTGTIPKIDGRLRKSSLNAGLARIKRTLGYHEEGIITCCILSLSAGTINSTSRPQGLLRRQVESLQQHRRQPRACASIKYFIRHVCLWSRRMRICLPIIILRTYLVRANDEVQINLNLLEV